jgi:hypothetical protein
MAEVEAPGGGLILASGRRIQRKVIVNTAGKVLAPSGDGQLVSAVRTEEPGGVTRGVFEFVKSDLSTPSGDDAIGGGSTKRVEIIGGSREVPVQQHPKFKDISDNDIKKITDAADRSDPSLLPETMDGPAGTLYQMLLRGVRYYARPAVTARVTDLESAVPSLDGLAKLGPAAVEGISEPPGSRWVLTGISASSVGTDFEVTREYTLTGDGTSFTDFLYA